MTALPLNDQLSTRFRLGPKLGTVCHLIRWTAVGWLAWVIYAVVSIWSSPTRLAELYSKIFWALICRLCPQALMLPLPW